MELQCIGPENLVSESVESEDRLTVGKHARRVAFNGRGPVLLSGVHWTRFPSLKRTLLTRGIRCVERSRGNHSEYRQPSRFVPGLRHLRVPFL